MEIESLACNGCGGPLQVPQSANYVTCNHCGSQLAIRRTESTTYTKQLDAIETKQDELIEKIDRLERTNLVAQLDREWQQERSRFMITDKTGQKHVPSKGTALASFVVAGFGVGWVLLTGLSSPSFAVFGVIFTGMAIAQGIATSNKSTKYRQAKRRYEKRRHELFVAPPMLSEVEEDQTSPMAFLAKMERESQ